MAPTVPSLVAEMVEALAAERAAVRASLGALERIAEVTVTDGKRLARVPGAYPYRFRCAVEVAIPEGTRVQLKATGARTSGEVVEHDLDLEQVQLVLRDDLEPEVDKALLRFETTHLLDLLQTRLEAIAASADGLPPEAGTEYFTERALHLLGGTARARPALRVERPGPSASQLTAIGFVLAQEVAYLWGPPGTGKTSTLAHLVHELLHRGERVLLTAHTNTATDTALLKVLRTAPLQPGEAVRVGPCSEELRARTVQLEDLVDRQLRDGHSDLPARIIALCEEVATHLERPVNVLLADRAPVTRRLRAAVDVLSESVFEEEPELREKARELTEAVDRLELEVVQAAKVVCCTLTRLFTSRLLKPYRADTALIDEASIASLSHTFVAASLARKRVVAIGDFMQLPAIVQSEHPKARSWLGRNVFQSAGCDDPAVDHPLRTLLHEQWRMQPGISGTVSRTFYASKLRDAPAVTARRAPGSVAALVDTSGLAPRSRRLTAGSKTNEVHAQLIQRLLGYARARQVAVITPYRAQVRLIRDAQREAHARKLEDGSLEVFTVHRFQGRDVHTVFFDLVEAPGTDAPFLNELSNPDAPNLVNVALSRAKERLVIVADLAHLTRALGRTSLLARVFTELRRDDALELDASDEQDLNALQTFLA